MTEFGPPFEIPQDDPDYHPGYQDEYQRLWHEAKAQVAALTQERDRLREDLGEVEGFWATTQFPEFIEYWFTIGRSCSAGDAIRQLMAEKEAAEAALADTRREYDDLYDRAARQAEELLTATSALEAIVRDRHLRHRGDTWESLAIRHVTAARRALAAAGGGTGQEQQP